MNHTLYRFLTLSLLTSLMPLLAGAANAQITVAAAANVQYAMEEISSGFKKATGIDVKAVYGSSGKLTTQIRNGAPFDLLVSADMDHPDTLVKWGYATGKPRPYAYGKLVLWTVKKLDLEKGLAVLADTGVGKIAVADPKRAPYGRESIKALKHTGIHDAVAARLVFGESIAQVNQYVLLGTVDIGLTAKSIVLAPDLAGKGVWKEVDSAAYSPIAQGAVVCKYGTEHNPGQSARFLDYLYSPPARSILSKYGYVLP